MGNSVNDIRKTFLDYFVKNGHEAVASGSLLPRNDPSLMFTNAGMVPFKNVFTGLEKRDYNRATSSQKCVRAGGKHNDLDNVGYTARHHTFFEMLGNFSFGDYFKDEAINFAWELLTKEFGLSKEKLLVTVYADDQEAREIWKKVTGFSDDKIIGIATDDNFWRMGDTGPCGPCTEIFYDHGHHIWGGPPGSPEEDGDRFIEIWNVVFMQYNQQASGEMKPLAKQSIDTGSGLERLSALLQGTHDNYETDMMQNLIKASVDQTGVDKDGDFKASHRVIVDHLRSSSFLIADGIMPSNEGRGYVLRRIMRRAMRHAHMMGCQDPLMYKLVPALVKEMGGHYTELQKSQDLIVELLKNEEVRFKATVDRGLHLLKEETLKLGDKEALSGEVAFKLFDTYGFPLDLTQDVLRSENRSVDVDGFNAAMAEQKKKARAAWSGSGDNATEEIWFDLKDELGATEFLGYSHESSTGDVVAIVKDGKRAETLKKGEEGLILTNQTPFYAESGGQVGDKGWLSNDDGSIKATVKDTQKKNDVLHVHVVKMEAGEVNVGTSLTMDIDATTRTSTKANHSATHLLHAALRRYFGDHVTQKGSLVTPEKLRFDFSHPGAISSDDIKTIEREVNSMIRQNEAVTVNLMTKDQATEAGAMALFGEKYGEEVRVVSMGKLDMLGGVEAKDGDYSIELCGGTHVNRTGDIGFFKITGVSTVAANVKRIEALTGVKATNYVLDNQSVLDQLSGMLSTTSDAISSRIDALLKEGKEQKSLIDNLRHQIALGGGGAKGSANDDIKEINGTKLVAKTMQDFPAKNLRSIADDLMAKIKSGVVALVAVNDGKAAILVSVSEDLTSKYNAVELVKAGVETLGGKGGGGRPDFAQGGGPDGAAADKAIEVIESKLA